MAYGFNVGGIRHYLFSFNEKRLKPYVKEINELYEKISTKDKKITYYTHIFIHEYIINWKIN